MAVGDNFKILTGASRFLDSLGLLGPNQFQVLQLLGMQVSDTIAIDTSQRLALRISDALRASISAGDSLKDWQKRVAKITDFERANDATLYRTITRRSYNAGFREVMETPAGDAFPYRQYLATDDSRVRPEHLKLNMKVYHKDSAMAARAREQLDDFNCRCTEVPLTETEARRIGIDDDVVIGGFQPTPQQTIPEAIAV